jgi:hypothetical protein
VSLLSQSKELAKSGAAWRIDLFGVKVTLGTGPAVLLCAKSPTKASRVQNEQGTGWVQRNLATFMTSPSWATRPAIGNEFTIQDSSIIAEIGTVWRIFDLTTGVAGEEDRCVCFRKD